ncbi:MAG: aldehyde dehydrogenase family protein, partial [Candidatus Marinimicrobia bacterium]|nr:aldehyde dehydrogenase family protein [Candidatus Neomarinimicrobiota bacterium]
HPACFLDLQNIIFRPRYGRKSTHKPMVLRFFGSPFLLFLPYAKSLGNGFPVAPFGGMNQSGIGREHGLEALEEFREAKHIFIDYDHSNKDWWYGNEE